MDSISMTGCRKHVALTPSPSFSHHLQNHAKTTFLPSGVKTVLGDSDSVCPATQPTVAILGSGDFSKCLTIRLLRHGFHVAVGSRNPDLTAQFFPHVVDVTHHEDAVGKASIVFLAIRREHYSVLWDLKHLLKGREWPTATRNHTVKLTNFSGFILEPNHKILLDCKEFNTH